MKKVRVYYSTYVEIPVDGMTDEQAKDYIHENGCEYINEKEIMNNLSCEFIDLEIIND